MAVIPLPFPYSGLSAWPLQRILGVKVEIISLSYLFLFLPEGHEGTHLNLCVCVCV